MVINIAQSTQWGGLTAETWKCVYLKGHMRNRTRQCIFLHWLQRCSAPESAVSFSATGGGHWKGAQQMLSRNCHWRKRCKSSEQGDERREVLCSLPYPEEENKTIFKCWSCYVLLCIIPDWLCFTEMPEERRTGYQWCYDGWWEMVVESTKQH